MLPALQVEVRDRQAHDADARLDELGDDHGELVLGQRAEPHAVARGAHEVLGPVANDASELAHRDGAVERLVGVQVGADAASLGDREQAAHLGVGIVGEVRRAAGEVEPAVEGALVGRVVHADGRQGDEFEVQVAGEVVAQPHECIDPAVRAVAREEVDVAADGRGARAQQLQRRRARTQVDVVLGEVLLERVERLDRLLEVAEWRVDRVPGERLVEVGVRLGGRGEQQVPGEVDDARGIRRHRRAGRQHLDDGAVGDHDVADSTVAERGFTEQRHGLGMHWVASCSGRGVGDAARRRVAMLIASMLMA
jgi:hypothetical protein